MQSIDDIYDILKDMESRKSSAEPGGSNFDRSFLPEDSSDAKSTKNKKQRPALSPDTPVNNAAVENVSLFDTAQRAESASVTKEHEKSFWESDPSAKEKDIDEEDYAIPSEHAKQVIEEHAEARHEVVNEELAAADEDSPKAAVALADKMLLEKIRDRLQQAEPTVIDTDAILSGAAQETVADLHLAAESGTPPHYHDAAEAAVSMTDTGQHAEAALPPEKLAELREAAIATIIAEQNPSDTAELEDTLQATFASGSPPPPQPPTSREGFAAEEPEPENSHAHPLPISNNMPVAQALGQEGRPATLSSIEVPEISPVVINRRPGDVAAGVLLGGMAGYMVGRRSGRKRTEKRLMPSAEKQQKEITRLQHSITEKEQYIRGLAAKKAALYQAEPSLQANQHRMPDAVPTPSRNQVQDHAPTAKPEAPAVVPPVMGTQKETSPLSRTPLRQKVAPKRIFSEGTTAVREQAKRFTEKPAPEASSTLQPVEQMPFAKVLSEAKQVAIGTKTLESYYISGQLNERSIRKVLAEYRRSKRPERILHSELRANERLRNASLERQRQSRVTQLAVPVNTPDLHMMTVPATSTADQAITEQQNNAVPSTVSPSKQPFASKAALIIAILIAAAVVTLIFWQ